MNCNNNFDNPHFPLRGTTPILYVSNYAKLLKLKRPMLLGVSVLNTFLIIMFPKINV